MWITVEWGRGPSPRKQREAQAAARHEREMAAKGWRAAGKVKIWGEDADGRRATYNPAESRAEMLRRWEHKDANRPPPKRPWRNGSA